MIIQLQKKIYINPNKPDDGMIDAWVYIFTASILIALALLSPVVIKLSKEYFSEVKKKK